MSSEQKTRDIVVTRVFDAPVGQVWQAWVDPVLVKQWWGPQGFTSPVANMDFREGGTSLVCMRASEKFGGQDFYNTWTYREIVPGERIEFVMAHTDQNGQKFDPVQLGLPPGVPQDVRHVVTFRPAGPDRTEMTVTEFGYTSDEVLELSKAGLEQCLDKMAAIFAKS